MTKLKRDLNPVNMEERIYQNEKEVENIKNNITEISESLPVANPETEATNTLEKVKINDITYEVGGGISEIPVATNQTVGGIKTSSDYEVMVDNNDVLKVNIPTSTSNDYADYNTNAVTPLQKFLRKIFPYKRANNSDYIGKIYRENVNGEGTLKTKTGSNSNADYVPVNRIDTVEIDTKSVLTPIIDSINNTITLNLYSLPIQGLSLLGSDHIVGNMDNTYPIKFTEAITNMINFDRVCARFLLYPFNYSVTGSILEQCDVKIIFSKVDYNITQNKVISSEGFFIDGIINAFKKAEYDAGINPSILTSKKYPYRFTNSLMTSDYYSNYGYSALTPVISTYTDENSENHRVIEMTLKLKLDNRDIRELFNVQLVRDNISIEIDTYLNRDVYNENYYYIPISNKVAIDE